MNKNLIVWLVWLGAMLVITIVAIIVAMLAFDLSAWSILVGVISYILINALLLLAGKLEVQYNYEAQLEIFSNYEETLGCGWYLIFPLFGICRIQNNTQYFLGQSTDKILDGPANLIDLEDVSVGIDGEVYYQIVDSEKAAYSVADFRKTVKEKSGSAVRGALGGKTFEEVNQNKREFNLARLFFPPEVAAIEEDYGVRLLEIVISDIILSAESMEIRKRILEAEANEEAAIVNRRTTKENAEAKAVEMGILSKAEKNKKIRLAEGEQEAIKKVKAELNGNVKDYIALKSLETITDKDKIIFGASGAAQLGTEFAFGQQVVNKKK
ncbi:MAG: SPFH domain-containing protein [Candidatus Falkowbacteria bacterium]|nr:SPFH domain-containing protein [Candidatus Falkowbacteria bacterium]